MAKSARPSKKDDAQGEVSVKGRVDVTEATAVIYINFAEVAHNVHEFSIICARTPTKPDATALELAKKSGVYPIEASTMLIVPPSLMKGLVRAMQLQIEKYETSFGQIIGDPPHE
jgi:hypothetical protein